MKKIAKILMGLMTFTMASGFISCEKNEPKGLDMVEIPGMSIKMLRTEVTQELYESVMGENPSYFQTGSEAYKEDYEEEYIITEGEKEARLPVENVSWYDAVYFCNKLSEKEGLTPVYSVNGITDVSKWGYTPHNGKSIQGNVAQNKKANGYRLPTNEEWEYAAEGGEDYTYYSGSDDLGEVGWYCDNSGDRTHSVAQKKANGYGLYDMNGNVWEWCSDVYPGDGNGRYSRGGSYGSNDDYCKFFRWYRSDADNQYSSLGFRIVCSVASGFSSCEKNEPKELDMVEMPDMSIKMLKTEVTQELYESVMGENPSYFQTGSEDYKEDYEEEYIITEGEQEARLPVEQVSWYDAIYFCNKLSEEEGLTPVYSVDGITDVSKWGYTPHNFNSIRGNVEQNTKANGYRLPTNEEWKYAAKGGEDYTYSGSDDLDEVGWYTDNSEDRTHEVAQKKANGYGLYDMSGNVWEWCWDVNPDFSSLRYFRGGSYDHDDSDCRVSGGYSGSAHSQQYYQGFRIVCNAD